MPVKCADFGKGPATGALEGQQNVDGFLGKAFVNSFNNRDKGIGTLTSPAFEITKAHVNFMIGGGAHKGRTCMDLRIGDEVVRTATGSEMERPAWTSWDVKELRGKTATLQIVDGEAGGWGHVNVDHIMLSDLTAKPTESGALWADYGRDFYAAVSWSDIPKDDGRRIWIGWMSNWQYAQDVPTSPWRSAMSVPQELGLQETPNGYRLTQTPVRELEKLRVSRSEFKGKTLAEANAWLAQQKGSQLLDVEFTFAGVAETSDFGLRVHGAQGAVVELRFNDGTLALDRTDSGKVDFHDAFPGVHAAPCTPADGALSLRILLDTSSLEVFAADGTAVITDLFLPAAGGYGLELFSNDGSSAPLVARAQRSILNSAW